MDSSATGNCPYCCHAPEEHANWMGCRYPVERDALGFVREVCGCVWTAGHDAQDRRTDEPHP